ncbi:hypothetical protein RhiirA5_257964, partial [Rhizophagus irregularis]
RTLILPALILDGFIAVDVFEGTYDRKRFVDFVLNQIVPVINPYPDDNSIIIMDNARIHHNAELISLME